MDKYKKLAFNTIIFAIGSFGSKIFSLLLNNLYTKHIEPTEFYTKSVFETAALFLLPIFTFSLTEAIIRYGLDKDYNKKQVFTTALILAFFGLILMAITVPLLKFVPFLSPIKDYTHILTIYILTSALRSLCSQFVRARGLVKLFSLDGILTTIALFIFNIIFISKLGLGIKGFMLSVILSDICSAIFLFFVARLYKYISIKSFNIKLGKIMLKFTLPLVPTAVIWTFTGMSDQLFIGNIKSDKVFLGEEAAGIYAAATKIPNLLSMLSTIFFQAWNMSAIEENNSAKRNEFYRKVYLAYEALLFTGCAGLILLIKPISAILINYDTFPQYKTAYIYSALLIAAAIFVCLNQFLFGIYTTTKHTKNAFFTVLIAAVSNILLNLFFIPKWGIQGAAFATFLSYVICYWLRMIDSRRYIKFKFSIVRHFVNLALILLMCFATILQFKIHFVYIIFSAIIVILINFYPLFLMAKKILKRDTNNT